jgi:hypothetical protein
LVMKHVLLLGLTPAACDNLLPVSKHCADPLCDTELEWLEGLRFWAVSGLRGLLLECCKLLLVLLVLVDCQPAGDNSCCTLLPVSVVANASLLQLLETLHASCSPSYCVKDGSDICPVEQLWLSCQPEPCWYSTKQGLPVNGHSVITLINAVVLALFDVPACCEYRYRSKGVPDGRGYLQ